MSLVVFLSNKVMKRLSLAMFIMTLLLEHMHW